MADDNITLEGANKLILRDLDPAELEAQVEEVWKAVESMREAEKISPELMRMVINI